LDFGCVKKIFLTALRKKNSITKLSQLYD